MWIHEVSKLHLVDLSGASECVLSCEVLKVECDPLWCTRESRLKPLSCVPNAIPHPPILREWPGRSRPASARHRPNSPSAADPGQVADIAISFSAPATRPGAALLGWRSIQYAATIS